MRISLTCLLTVRSRVLLEKLSGFQLVKKFPHFIEPEVSLPRSQVSSTFPCPEPARSSPCPHIPLAEDPILISYHLRLGLPSGFFPLFEQNCFGTYFNILNCRYFIPISEVCTFVRFEKCYVRSLKRNSFANA